MKVELIKQMGKMKPGETLIARSKEQGEMLIDNGFAKETEQDPVVEKHLVLRNPEPGTYTTALVEKKTAGKESGEKESSGTALTYTAVELIEKINSAVTVDEVNALAPESETRKTVTAAATKKIEELSK